MVNIAIIYLMPIAPVILKVLRDKVLPWAQDWQNTRLLVASSRRTEFLKHNGSLPVGVTCSSQPLIGKRVAVHGQRSEGNRSVVAAVWPEDRLVAPRLPIIICPFEGRMDFRIGDYLIHSVAGQFFLLPPGVPRDDGLHPHLLLSRGPDSTCSLLWLRPYESGLECWICYSHGERHWGGTIADHIFILHHDAPVFFTALEHGLQQGGGGETLGRGLLIALLAILYKNLSIGQFYGVGTMGQTAPKAVSMENPIAYAQDYIHEHLDAPLTINQVAQAVYLARTQFINRFRQETGKTFTEFLTACRLEKAQKLLRETNLAVLVVANLVGIQPSHLRRLFNKNFHVSPEEYRRRCAQPSQPRQPR